MFTKKKDSGYMSPQEGVRLKTLAYGKKTHLTEFRLEKGHTVPKHKHPHEQTGYLVSGRMKFFIAEESFDALPGDAWNIAGDVEHSAEILEDAVVVEVFSPVREEYLP